MTIEYSLQLEPQKHLLTVALRVARPDPGGQILALPAWVPGSYTIRNLARHLVQIRAQHQGHELAIHKFAKDRWRVEPCAGPLEIHYQIYALDLSVRTAYLDDLGGFINGPAVFLRVVGQEEELHTLEMAGPGHWQLATTLERDSGAEWSWGIFHAPNYRDLCDHPLLMGHLQRVDFQADGLPHQLALWGHPDADLLRLGRDLASICQVQQKFWGSLPFSQYLFLCMGSRNGYGGLEHRRSAALLCSRRDLDGSDDAAYRQFLGLASHEYFHSWLVQGIRPAVWAQSYWDREILSQDLWIYEGFTSYYDGLLLCRAGLWSEEVYLGELGREITRLRQSPGEHWQSLSESSTDAWIKLYHPHPASANFEISYYNKGALLALCLDARIRQRHGQQQSLDDILRRLWQEYGLRQPLPEGELLTLLAQWEGVELAEEINGWLHQAEPLPLAECLAILGVSLQYRAGSDDKDRGGKPGSPRRCDLGASLQAASLGVTVERVRLDGPAERAGICPGDHLLALDGEQILADNLQAQLDRLAPGVPRDLHFLRDGRLLQRRIFPEEAPLDCAFLTPLEDPQSQHARELWLHPANH